MPLKTKLPLPKPWHYHRHYFKHPEGAIFAADGALVVSLQCAAANRQCDLDRIARHILRAVNSVK